MAAVKTLPLDYDLVIYSGTTFKKEFRWKPDGVNPIDLTGWSGVMNVGVPGTPALVAVSTDTDGLTLTSNGEIQIRIDQIETSTLVPGVLAYNLDLTDLAGDIRRLFRGRVSVVQDVQDE